MHRSDLRCKCGAIHAAYSHSLEHRVESAGEVHFAAAILVAHLAGQVLDDGRARLVGQIPRFLVAHPAVNTTAAGIYPEDVLESEVLW